MRVYPRFGTTLAPPMLPFVFLMLVGNQLSAADQVFRHPSGVYEVRYPQGWYREPNATSLCIYSFSLDRRRPQVVLPDDGAMIVFVVPHFDVHSLSEWESWSNKRRSPYK